MAKRGRPKKDEQLPLIDVGPENAPALIKLGKKYKEALDERLAWLNIEVAAKTEMLALVDKAKMKPLPDGKIRFKVDGMTITVTPTDRRIAVKLDDPDGE